MAQNCKIRVMNWRNIFFCVSCYGFLFGYFHLAKWPLWKVLIYTNSRNRPIFVFVVCKWGVYELSGHAPLKRRLFQNQKIARTGLDVNEFDPTMIHDFNLKAKQLRMEPMLSNRARLRIVKNVRIISRIKIVSYQGFKAPISMLSIFGYFIHLSTINAIPMLKQWYTKSNICQYLFVINSFVPFCQSWLCVCNFNMNSNCSWSGQCSQYGRVY